MPPEPTAVPEPVAAPAVPAYRGLATLKLLTSYQWFVLLVCCAAWDMDCLDQQLFVLARNPAMRELVAKQSLDGAQQENYAKLVTAASTHATMYFMIGWAVGGVAFGIMGDRVGRVKTLTLTILLYAVFTGLSAFAQSTTDFYLYRFLTGLGVGGVFAAAVTLLAETMPDAARPYALGLFQASSVLGNCAAALLSMYLGHLQYQGQLQGLTLFSVPLSDWRIMFLVGILPALLVVVIQARLHEPEKWQQARVARRLAGGAAPNLYGELFGDRKFLRHALLGLVLALAGVVGLWGIGFFTVDLMRGVLDSSLTDEAKAIGLSGVEVERYVGGQKTFWTGVISLVQNFGSFWGIFAFSLLTARVGRRPAFALFFVLAAVTTAAVFGFLSRWQDIFWMVPLMGFFQLALFGGYAIYLPELFPTRLRSTGTSFCYNVGRLFAAFGPFVLGTLTTVTYVGYGDDAFRYAGVTMCSVFLVGLAVLPFLPETKGRPLPE